MKKTNWKKLTLHRSFRRLAAVGVMVGASLALARQAPPAYAQTGCEPTANVPRYNDYTDWASASGTVRCAGYYDLRLMTTSGTTLKRMSGYYTSTLYPATPWVTCPSGTSVYTYLYEEATVQGRTFKFTATSAPFLCP
jgi:hypothetical protein